MYGGVCVYALVSAVPAETRRTLELPHMSFGNRTEYSERMASAIN